MIDPWTATKLRRAEQWLKAGRETGSRLELSLLP